jgi:hypothetical protein
VHIFLLIFLNEMLIRRINKHFVICRLSNKVPGERLLVWSHVKVDQAVFLEELMYAKDRTRVTRQMSSASCCGQVGVWLHLAQCDDE